jgi:hypothetical protein
MITQGRRVCHAAFKARNSDRRNPEEAAMMDEALKTHKETSFGWVRAVRELVRAYRAWLARLAREQTTKAIREAEAKPRRYLAPR